ncbi:MAG TPA: signal peptidase I [Microbacteriaceae bacterium]|nr:signal peptidase I [Microbacteriaceae bacterium]
MSNESVGDTAPDLAAQGDDGAHTVEESTPAPPARPSKRSGAMNFARDVLVIVLSAIVISFLIKTFLVRSFYIPSASMENTLMINDRIMVNQLVPKVWGLERGDVVVFSDPGGWLAGQAQAQKTPTPLQAFVEGALSIVGLTAPDSNDHLVKRVIGLPGDHVTCCTTEGLVEINGVPIEEPYVRKPEGQLNNASTFDETVPANSLFVMGDNRNQSKDSRYQKNTPLGGFVPVSNVVGVAFVITWPVDRWSWVSNYSPNFSEVPAATTSGP